MARIKQNPSPRPPVLDENTRKLPKKTPVKRRRRKFFRSRIDREIKRLQASQARVIPKGPFCRLVREIAVDQRFGDVRFTKGAMAAIQEVVEQHMHEKFLALRVLAAHRGKKTLCVEDFKCLEALGDARLVSF